MGFPRLMTALVLASAVFSGGAMFGNPAAAGEIYIGDIVAGGDGTGNAPEDYIGVNADTGFFEFGHNNASIINSGMNPELVEESTFIDSVFILETPLQVINLEGAAYQFGPQDASGNTWNHIISDATHDIDKGITDIWAGGINTWRGAVGIHASAGVTIDLEEVRNEHGFEVVRYFQAFMGTDQCGGQVTLHAILSDDLEPLDAVVVGPFAGNQGEFVSLEIPDEAYYLTLAVGAADGGIGCAHGVFAEAVITDTFPANRSVSTPGGDTPCPPFGGGPIEVTITSPLGDGDPDEVVTINEFISGPVSGDQVRAEGALVEERLPSSLNEEGFIKTWLLMGPFQQSFGAAPAIETIQLDYLTDGDAGELVVEPVAGEQIETDFALAASTGLMATPNAPSINPGGVPTWNLWADDDDTINFNDFYGGDLNNLMMYAFAYVIFEDDMDVDIALGSDDAVQVLFDYQEAWVNSVGRGCGGTNQVQDLVMLNADLGTIEAGVHTVMVKVFEGGGGNCFRLRFQDSFTGLPITEGIEVCLAPDQVPCEWASAGVDVTLEASRGDLAEGVSYEIDLDDGDVEMSGWIGQRTIGGETSAHVESCVGPVAELGCNLRADGLALSWINPAQADLEGTISISVDGEEVAVVPGDSTSALVPDDGFAPLGSRVCVTNPSGLSACCGAYPGTELHINCGGGALSEAAGNALGDGRTWLEDSAENPSPFLVTSEAVAQNYREMRRPPFEVADTQLVEPGFVDSEAGSVLFATEREFDGDIVYSIAMPRGNYEVTLLFAEGANSQGCLDLEDPAESASYCRVSDLYLNGELVADQFSRHVEAQRALGNELPNANYGVALARGPYVLEGVNRVTVRVGDLPGGSIFRPNKAAINGISIRQVGDGPPVPPPEICDNGVDDDGNGEIDCQDAFCVDAPNCQVAPGERFVRGDANSDGSINLTDGVIPLLFLFSGGTPPACADATDTNDTGNIEITDAIIIFSWLFTGGAPPQEPTPLSPGYASTDCGVDASDDGLGCEQPSPTCQ